MYQGRIMNNYIFILLAASLGASIYASDFVEAQKRLHQAILSDSSEQIQQALIAGSIQNTKNETFEWCLIKAIARDNEEEIKKAAQKLIAEGKNGNSPAVNALMLKKPNALEILLQSGATIDANLIKLAIKEGDFKSALIIAKNREGLTTIMHECVKLSILSCKANNINIATEFLKTLIHLGYDVNNALTYHHLYNPRLYGSNLLEFFIHQGANPKHKNRNTLELAVKNNNKKAVEVLLNAGADIRSISHQFMALNCLDLSMLKLLRKHGFIC